MHTHRVKLVTDPNDAQGGSIVDFSSQKIGSMRIEVGAKMSENNPKTSAIVAPSVVKAIRNYTGDVVLGA